MAEDSKWMPVFVLVTRHDAVHAAHPDHKGALPKGDAEDLLQRAGTAWREADGSYLIELTALPLNGRLLMRPPRQGESPDSATRERRS